MPDKKLLPWSEWKENLHPIMQGDQVSAWGEVLPADSSSYTVERIDVLPDEELIELLDTSCMLLVINDFGTLKWFREYGRGGKYVPYEMESGTANRLLTWNICQANFPPLRQVLYPDNDAAFSLPEQLLPIGFDPIRFEIPKQNG